MVYSRTEGIVGRQEEGISEFEKIDPELLSISLTIFNQIVSEGVGSLSETKGVQMDQLIDSGVLGQSGYLERISPEMSMLPLDEIIRHHYKKDTTEWFLDMTSLDSKGKYRQNQLDAAKRIVFELFTSEEGGIIEITGPMSCGKSTVAGIVSGVLMLFKYSFRNTQNVLAYERFGQDEIVTQAIKGGNPTGIKAGKFSTLLEIAYALGRYKYILSGEANFLDFTDEVGVNEQYVDIIDKLARESGGWWISDNLDTNYRGESWDITRLLAQKARLTVALPSWCSNCLDRGEKTKAFMSMREDIIEGKSRADRVVNQSERIHPALVTGETVVVGGVDDVYSPACADKDYDIITEEEARIFYSSDLAEFDREKLGLVYE